MAENQSYWGIDIGQAGLKAIRLRYAEAAGQAIAIAYDYVPHPKILSQPDANPDELIPQALETFLSRNDVDGDVLAISVPGQSSLARFIQLPPVEKNKVAEIVKYEARQQIPFDLDDVIWDYQTLGSGSEEGGYMLEAEVGLFAMKRADVLSNLKPFADKNLEVELIQTAPLALYNMLTYDQFGDRPGAVKEQKNYTIVCDMGVDNTTLLVSNGRKIWLRNVPIGGNHFTRALTKQMKLTFAKAEHLKCNATKSPDPRAVFQALRPVFNDYVAEIQRSIGYFSSVNKEATIGQVIGVGNGFKLAGLQKFLQQSLQYDVEKIDKFQALVGDNVLHAPLFEENILTFAVPYGLALQAMGQTSITTTLLPPEIATARKVRAKKPWAVLTAAMLLLAMSISAMGYAGRNQTVSVKKFSDAEQTVKTFNTKVKGKQEVFDGMKKAYEEAGKQEDNLLVPLRNGNRWAELQKSVNGCLPRDVGVENDITTLTKKKMVKINAFTAQRVEDVGVWFSELQGGQKDYMLEDERKTGVAPPKGPGYIVTLDGHHFHNDEEEGKSEMKGVLFVKNTLLAHLQKWTYLPPKSSKKLDIRKLGISHATIIANKADNDFRIEEDGQGFSDTNGLSESAYGSRGRGGRFAPSRFQSKEDNEKEEEVEPITKTSFKIQFIWQPIPLQDRKDTPPEIVLEKKNE
ncbi:probable fimbrial assembly protein PilM [hydrothermal vent metagenome]|uniref:Probable fimbrial assembly protein PilM n=1 Tax=hydrothermal vent metagenome TaxID=652676 RepID=A0A3B1DAT5_9ZZZZ